MKIPKNYHVFNLKQNTLTLILHKRGEVRCYTCGKEVNEGERVLSKNGGAHNSKNVLRHFECAKRIGLI